MRKRSRKVIEKSRAFEATKAREAEGFRKSLARRVKCHENINNMHCQLD